MIQGHELSPSLGDTASRYPMRAAILTGLKTIEIVERPVAEPAKGEVALAINAVGICGSDLAYWAQGVAGGFKKLDFSAEGLCKGYCGQMGHECAGTVIAVGEGVDSLVVGDRVALEPGVPCGTCVHCRKGRYNLCKSMRFIGSAVNEVPGAMVTRFNHPAAFCYKLPTHISLDEGAMFEPLCVALQAVRRARVGIAMRVLITGAGPIGLMTLLAAKAAGATVLAITDMVDAKLVVARTLGATYTFKANTPNLVSVAQQAVGGEFDVTFECSGVVPALDLCVSATGSGGVLCVVANYKADEAGRTPVRLQELARREIDLVGVYRYCNLYPTALELVSSGAVNLKPLISRKFSLEQAGHAFEYFATGEPIKVLITPNEAAGDDGCKPCEFDGVSLEKARDEEIARVFGVR